VKHLKNDFPGIELVEADLLNNGSFASAVDGIEILFHTASPFLSSSNNPQTDLIDPALNGTINVLTDALKVKTLKKIILTSSVAAVRGGPKAPGEAYTDTDWNTAATIEAAPYPLSKVLAEKKAWEMVETHNKQHPEHQVKLVTICPSWVLGPPFGTRIDSVSVGTIVSWLDGSVVDKGVRCLQVPTIDVRDVAAAHIAAAEVESAHGRYLATSADVVPPLEIIQIFKKLYPEKALPDKMVPGNLNPAFKVDPSRTERELGIHWTPLETTLKDMADKLIELGVIKPN